jgi:HK97 family phage prohead protease
MEIKKISQAAELGTSENEVLIKVSGFNNEDSHVDIIRDTAYNRTIKNNKGNIKHLIEHWHDFENIVGLPKEFEVRSDGLWVLSAINRSTDNGEYTYNQYKFFAENGMNIDHSVGFTIIKTQKNDELTAHAAEKFGDYYPYIKDRVGRDITEVKLHEYSTVFMGSNSEANQLYIKSDFDLNEFIRLSLTEEITPQKLDNLKNALLHAEGTQEIDPPKTPQIVDSFDLKQFADIFINAINNTKN